MEECSGCNGVDLQKAVKENIETHGWHASYIFPDENNPGFLYTVGLTKTYDHPEIIVFGVDKKQAYMFIAPYIQELIQKKQKIPLNTPDETFFSMPFYFAEVFEEQKEMRLRLAEAYYSEKKMHYSAIQLLWCDTKGKFPFHKEFEEKFKAAQPLISKA